MALEGTLTRYRMAEILFEVARRERTGILTVQGQDDIVAISFLKGRIVAADALNRTVEDGLRDVLVEREWITLEEFSALASEHQAGGGRVLDLVVERGYLGRDRMLDALREQTYRLLLEVFAWRGGDYKFYGGDEVYSEEGLEPLSVSEALVRAAREMGSDGPLIGRVPSPDTVYQRGSSGSVSPPSESDLSIAEKSVLGAVDGHRTVAEIAEEAGGDPHETTHLLHRLEQVGLIRIRVAGGSVARAPIDWGQSEERSAALPEPVASGARSSSKSILARRLAAVFPGVMPWLSGVAAGLFAVFLLAVLVVEPMRFLYPFPWERGELKAAVDSRGRGLLLKLDGAIRAFQLVEGRPPGSLLELEEAGLVKADDFWDPTTGRRLVLSSGETSFSVLEMDGGSGDSMWGTGSFTGDFLLEPAFYDRPSLGDRPPLVLLD